MVFLLDENRFYSVQETCEGRITEASSGSGGFGYDPVFFDDELGMTAAQMPPEVKNARSHRGRAVAALLRDWPGFWKHVQTEREG